MQFTDFLTDVELGGFISSFWQIIHGCFDIGMILSWDMGQDTGSDQASCFRTEVPFEENVESEQNDTSCEGELQGVGSQQRGLDQLLLIQRLSDVLKRSDGSPNDTDDSHGVDR